MEPLLSAYKALRPAQRAFVDCYITELEGAAHKTGSKLAELLEDPRLSFRGNALDQLRHPLVRAAIVERVTQIAEAAEISAVRVLKETTALATSNIANYFTIGEDGFPEFDLSKCTPEQMACIASIEIEENNVTGKRKFKFKLHDKVKPLDMLMRFHRMYEPDTVSSNAIGVPVQRGLPPPDELKRRAALFAEGLDQ